MIDPDCHYGDHTWQSGGVCVRCGKQLRCLCGRFIREDELEKHMDSCPSIPGDATTQADYLQGEIGGPA